MSMEQVLAMLSETNQSLTLLHKKVDTLTQNMEEMKANQTSGPRPYTTQNLEPRSPLKMNIPSFITIESTTDTPDYVPPEPNHRSSPPKKMKTSTAFDKPISRIGIPNNTFSPTTYAQDASPTYVSPPHVPTHAALGITTDGSSPKPIPKYKKPGMQLAPSVAVASCPADDSPVGSPLVEPPSPTNAASPKMLRFPGGNPIALRTTVITVDLPPTSPKARNNNKPNVFGDKTIGIRDSTFSPTVYSPESSPTYVPPPPVPKYKKVDMHVAAPRVSVAAAGESEDDNPPSPTNACSPKMLRFPGGNPIALRATVTTAPTTSPSTKPLSPSCGDAPLSPKNSNRKPFGGLK